MVARMSTAICGTAFPRMSLRSSGLRDHGAINVIARSEFSNGSPHERSDMRDGLSPDVASLIRATDPRAINVIARSELSNGSPHEHSDMRDGLSPDVASFIRATGPTGPSTSLRGANSAMVARMSTAICGTVFPRMSLRSYGLRDHKVITVIARGEFSNGSPHERSDMRDGLPRMSLSLIRATGPTGPSTTLRGANSAMVARMSAAICGTVFPGCRFRSSGLQDPQGHRRHCEERIQQW